MNEKRESSATIDRKKSIRNAVRIVTIGKNGVAYNNSQVVRGCVLADDPYKNKFVSHFCPNITPYYSMMT